MNITEINSIIGTGLALLPAKMDTPRARMMIVAIGMQESKFLVRKQMGNGPARSFWQFEEGNARSRGGVWGTMNHSSTAGFAKTVADAFGISFDSRSIWQAMETNDSVGVAFARLLLWTDARPLPNFGEADAGWAYYLRCWNPGKPKPETWPQAFSIGSNFYEGT